MIYHACRHNHNFGDFIGPFLYLHLLGKDYQFAEDLTKPHLMIAGSILQEATSKTTVLGCGFGAEDQRVTGKPKLLIIRGKLTEKILLEQGFRKTWMLADPGLFLPFVYNPTIEKQHKLGIIPHYADYSLVDGHKIDLTGNIHQIINQTLACEKIISSSLHGLIMAHAYGIPAQWVEFSDNVVGGGFKFRDYFSSVGIDQAPLDCRSSLPLNVYDKIPNVSINLDQFKPAFNLLKRNLK